MNNHTIKAKNKNSQEVRSINVVDNGDNCEYYDDKWDVIYSKQEFNDLFEVVENKPIKLNGSCGHTLEYDIPQTDKEDWEEKTLERFAKLEHIRWAKWQNYLHSFLTWNNDIQAWVLPHEKKERWQSQIETPYSMLSEKEKESDREQVKPYLNLITQEIAKAKEKERNIIKGELIDIKIKPFKRLGYTGETNVRQNCIDEILNFINKSNETT